MRYIKIVFLLLSEFGQDDVLNSVNPLFNSTAVEGTISRPARRRLLPERETDISHFLRIQPALDRRFCNQSASRLKPRARRQSWRLDGTWCQAKELDI